MRHSIPRMPLSLADLDQWNPDSIHEVFQATLSRAEVTRLTADSLTRVIAAVPWSGEAHDAALRENNAIAADLRLHAAEVEAVSRAASIAEVEIRAVKSDWQKICRMADRWGITIDTATNSIVPPDPLPDDADEVERRMQILEDQIVALLQRADDADSDLAAAIDGASGQESADDLNRGVQGTTAEEKENVDRFIKVFGRPPTTPEDWEKVSWLDPSNSDPAVKGVESSVVVANIRPVPGQGTVRGSLFIMDDQVLDPFAPDGFDVNAYGSLYDYGNNRGFSEHFDLRNAKGAFLIDYDSGVVIFRQNPTHDTLGQVKIGDPDVRVTQADDGTVRMDYELPNPAAMLGPVNMAEAFGLPVKGTIFVTPGSDGPRASGLIGNYPSAEIYADKPDGTTRVLLRDEQDDHSIVGPMLELGHYHLAGSLPSPGLQKELDFARTHMQFAGPGGSIQVRESLPSLNPGGTRLVHP